MDLTRFDDAKFDVKKWINDTLAKERSQSAQALDTTTQQQINKLQLLLQDLSQYFSQQVTTHFKKQRSIQATKIEIEKSEEQAKHLLRRVERLMFLLQRNALGAVNATSDSEQLSKNLSDAQVELMEEERAIATLEQLQLLHSHVQRCVDVLRTNRTLASTFSSLEQNISRLQVDSVSGAGSSSSSSAAAAAAATELEAEKQLQTLCEQYEIIERGQDLLSNAGILNEDSQHQARRRKILEIREEIEKKLSQRLGDLLVRMFAPNMQPLKGSSIDSQDLIAQKLRIYLTCLVRIGRLRAVLIDSSDLLDRIVSAQPRSFDTYVDISNYLSRQSPQFTLLDQCLVESQPSDAGVSVIDVRVRLVHRLAAKLPLPRNLDEWTLAIEQAIVFYDSQQLELGSEQEVFLRKSLFKRFEKILERYAEEESAALLKSLGTLISSQSPQQSRDLLELAQRLEVIGEQFFQKTVSSALERCKKLTLGVESQALVRVVNDAILRLCNQTEQFIFDHLNSKKGIGASSEMMLARQALRLVPLAQSWKQMLRTSLQPQLRSALLSWSSLDHSLKQHLFSQDKLKSVVSFFKSVEMDLPLLDVASKRLDELETYVHQQCLKLFLAKVHVLLQQFETTYIRLEDDENSPYDLPSFRSRGPSDYIQQIGDYIITLPEQFEKLESEKDTIKQWLDEICEAVVKAIIDGLQKLEKALQAQQPSSRPISRNAWQQLLADMLQINNVVDLLGHENIGLESMIRILKCSSKEEMKQELTKLGKLQASAQITSSLRVLVDRFKEQMTNEIEIH